jgi:glycosyltransferase involved in cell wall biosynthesis
MKVLFDHPSPFFLAHGGFQLQIEQTKAALGASGVAVDLVRWWDAAQRGDLIHYFGRPTPAYIQFAHKKGLPVVFTELLGGLSSRPAWKRTFQRWTIRVAKGVLNPGMLERLSWAAYTQADAAIALTEWERQLMIEMFSAVASKVHVIPNGVEEVFLQSKPATRDKWLVCTATIRDVKRVVELAEAALIAKVYIWFIGSPYSEADPYAKRFLGLASANKQFVRYEGPISDREALAQAYRTARGFVLLSHYETLSIAALEGAACGCPLLLSDRPWGRMVFGNNAMYCPIGSASATASVLSRFYAQAPNMKPPPVPKSWNEIARDIKGVYEQVLKDRPIR